MMLITIAHKALPFPQQKFSPSKNIRKMAKQIMNCTQAQTQSIKQWKKFGGQWKS
jgi:hypothetical protein